MSQLVWRLDDVELPSWFDAAMFEEEVLRLALQKPPRSYVSGVLVNAILHDGRAIYAIEILVGDDGQVYFTDYNPEGRHDKEDFYTKINDLISYLSTKEWVLPHFETKVTDNELDVMEREIREKRHRRATLDEFDNMIKSSYESVVEDLLSHSDEPIQLEVEVDKEYVSYGYFNIELKYRLGTERLYVVKDIQQQLIQAVRDENVLTLGKTTRPIKMLAENFDEASRFHLEFLQQYYDEDAQLTAKNRFVLGWDNIEQFIQHYKDTPYFDLAEIESDARVVATPSGDGKFRLAVTYPALEDEELIYRRGVILSQKQGHWLSYRELAPIDFTLLLKRNHWNELDFSKERIYQLKESIERHSKIFQMEIESDDILAPGKPQLYLDLTDDEALSVKVVYPSENKMHESLMAEMLANFDAELVGAHDYIIEKPKHIDYWLNEMMGELHVFGDVFVSDVFKNMRRPSRLGLSVGVSVKKNTIQLDFDSSLVDLKELAEILKSYRQKKKFHRLKSGERIALHERELHDFTQLLDDLNLDEKKLRKTPVPSYRMYQVQGLPSEYLAVDFDEAFETMFTAEPLELAGGIREILRPYQIEGAEWLLQLRAMNLGGILADDMGLGKSIQMIAYLMSVMPHGDKSHLIVAPASLLYNWEAEFTKFTFPYDVYVVTGKPAEREEMIRGIEGRRAVYVTSYDYLRRDAEFYEGVAFDTVVLDEAQYIKNKATRTAQIVKELTAEHRFALTGTPIENSLAELWSIFDFLMPGYLYPYAHFVKHYERPIVVDGDEEASLKLKGLVEPFILRRLKSDVLTELPEKLEETFYIGQSEREMQLYQATLASMQKDLASKMDLKSQSVQVLAMLTRLRQLSLDPRLVYDNIYERSSKIQAVVNILVESARAGEKVLVFSSFVSGLELVETALLEEGVSYLKLTGATPKETRRDYVSEFQREDSDVTAFLISLKAGGTGLNLTAASKVIHLDPWWNVSAQNQATDRAHRYGQESVVEVVKLVSKGTIEEKIEQLQADKQEIADIFVENSAGSIKMLSEGEIRELFS